MPLHKHLVGAAITLVVGMIGGRCVPYRNTRLVVRDRPTGEADRAAVPYQADATDEIAAAQRLCAEDSKEELDRRGSHLAD